MFARRFRRNAAILVVAAALALAALVAGGVVLIVGGDLVVGITALAAAFALVAASAVYAVIALPRSRALRQVSAVNPHGAVFLARRQPSVISDLAAYVGGAGDILDQVSDRWVVASIDARGMAAWSVTREARELVLVPWSEIGPVTPTALEDGRPGIAVDVKPFPTPLVVAVGYSAFGILTAFGRRGMNEVVEVSNALRPVSG